MRAGNSARIFLFGDACTDNDAVHVSWDSSHR
jgi:hypothetical protein